jgi:hypothetical protein
MNIVKILKSIMFNQDGSLLGNAFQLFGKSKENIYDPYADLRKQYTSYLGNKLGNPTPYSYNDAFTEKQPDIEKQTEGVVSNKLGQLPQTETDLFGVYDRYAQARKASAEEKNNADLKEQQNMYNRLGLVSSTPYLTDSAELRRKQGVDMDLTNADIARQGVDATQKAYGLNNNIATSWVNQGNVLGQIQRKAQEFGMQMSEEDIKRMIEEEQGYAGLANSLLGRNAPERSFSPGNLQKLGMLGNATEDDLLKAFSVLGQGGGF